MTLDITDLSDGELAALTLAGRSAAFSEIMRRHRDPIYRLVRGYIGDAEEALDITQDCFATAFQHLARYDQERPLRAWLARMAINKSRDWRRRRKIREILLLASALPRGAFEEIGDETPAADDLTFSKAELARLEQAIARLPTRLKEVLLLRTIEGLNQAETAATLGISRKAVETRLHRARKQLAELFQRR